MRLALAAITLALIPTQMGTPSLTPLTDRQVYQIGLDSLVGIIVMDEESIAMGSGAIAGRDTKGRQVAITAAHLFARNRNLISVHVSEDKPSGTPLNSVRANLLAYDEAGDLALVALEKDLPRKSLRLGTHLKQTDPLYWFGDPDEAPTSFGKGVLTRRNYPGDGGHGTAQYLGMVWPGESGGPILDEFGGLSGIVSAVNMVSDPIENDKRVLMEDIGYCVQQPAIKRILDKAGVK